MTDQPGASDGDPRQFPYVLRGVRPMEARRANTAATIQTLLSGPLPRAGLATRLELSQATVSKIVNPMIESGLLEELDTVSGERGRPKTPVRLVPDARAVIGMHIGLTQIHAGLVNLTGQISHPITRTHQSRRPGAVLSLCRRIIGELIERAGPRPLGIGVSIGGWVDSVTGVVRQHEALGWTDVGLVGSLGSDRETPIWLESSSRAHAQAEMWFGAAMSEATFVQVFVGNVIEVAVVVDRQIQHGVGGAAGMLGGLLVRTGNDTHAATLAEVATDVAILAQARRKRIAVSDTGLAELIAAAADNRHARRLLNERGSQVGRALASLVDILDPPLVVMSGGIIARTEDMDILRDAVRSASSRGADASRIVASQLGEHSLVLASASAALNSYFADPLRYDEAV